MENKKSKNFNNIQYQVKYSRDLIQIEESSLLDIDLANHFAMNGYEHLYISRNGKIVKIITFEDFYLGRIIEGLNREFVASICDLKEKTDIQYFFVEHPEVDRISVVDGEKLVCEIDSLVEFPIQNGSAKSLMSLRFIDLFYEDMKKYFKQYKKVLIIGDQAICDFLYKRFPNVVFERISDVSLLVNGSKKNDYDGVLDFTYCRKIRRTIGFNPDNLMNLPKELTRCALSRLIEKCSKTGVRVLFYQIPRYEKLTCLSSQELKNCVEGKKAGELIKDEAYRSLYDTNYEESTYLDSREYQASIRIDNGITFIQDDCNEESLSVKDGVRKSAGKNNLELDVPCINFYGPCMTYGFYTPDKQTIPSIVALMAERNGKALCVANRAGLYGNNELNSVMNALLTPVRNGDYIVFYDTLEELDETEYPNIETTYEWFNSEKSENEIWFLDFPGHCNPKANKLLAKHILDGLFCDMSKSNKESVGKREPVCCVDEVKKWEYFVMTHSSCVDFFRAYREHILDKLQYQRIGAIVIGADYNHDMLMDLIRAVIRDCDGLYVLHFDINARITDGIYELPNDIGGVSIRCMQLGYYFVSERYLNTQICSKPDIEKYIDIEKALLEGILNVLGVKVRYLAAGHQNDQIESMMADLYRDYGIELSYVGTNVKESIV